MKLVSGIYLLHKPVGATSAQVLRDFVGGRASPKTCHGGTLDPFARGLLLVLAGPATRMMEVLHGLPKAYEADIRWGVETDTGDPLGKPAFSGGAVTAAAIEAASRAFLGWTDQIPPATSAKKVGGEPAYRRVHRGESVVLPASRVFLRELEWLGHDLPETSRVRLVCRGGFYVRAFARDLGRALGSSAHVATLWRSRIGPWSDPEAPVHLGGPDAVSWCPTRALSGDEAFALKEGRSIPLGDVAPPAWEGFLDGRAPVAGLQRGRVTWLLQAQGPRLLAQLKLVGGL